MRFFIKNLTLIFKRSTEVIPFERITYFYGQMGAGKSSIAWLIDYCLGGDLDLTPAFQQEFIAAKLLIDVNGKIITLERQRDSDKIVAVWGEPDNENTLLLPARKAEGEVLANTDIEVLSDFIFYMAGINPPRVRKSKNSEESELVRLSLRDYLWYCYLDQDTIDSSFFNLEAEANTFKRLKSRDVLRSILGYHQEAVAQLESELLRVRDTKNQMRSGALLLKETLTNNGIISREETEEKVNQLTTNLDEVKKYILSLKLNLQRVNVPHIVEGLKQEARILAKEIETTIEGVEALKSLIDDNTAHLNEIKSLKIKYQRGLSARYVLSNVQFESCPRCAQDLPLRATNYCHVCGQEEPTAEDSKVYESLIQKDADSRISELAEIINNYELQFKQLYSSLQDFLSQKSIIDKRIVEVMQQYDSAYLANVLEFERRRFELEQMISNFNRSMLLFKKVDEQLARADELEVKEKGIRESLKEARSAAEKDVQNIRKLQQYFLDYLVQAGVPGIKDTDKVNVSTSTFLPLVAPNGGADVAVTSFSNLSSGGKKVLFKCCFALAIHRLAVETKASLPTFLVIDSPMKNISERENEEAFVQFHNLVYQLAAGDLSETQFILIDKEYCKPEANLGLDVLTRHMTPDNDEYPPLISYYRGH
jgi:hypothetical protein